MKTGILKFLKFLVVTYTGISGVMKSFEPTLQCKKSAWRRVISMFLYEMVGSEVVCSTNVKI